MALKIELGAGPASAKIQDQNWKTNDINAFPSIDFICPCYNLPMVENDSVDELLAIGVVEHLTYKEVAQGLIEWKRILKVGGFLTFDLPDLEFYIAAYLGKLGKEILGSAQAGGDCRAAEEPDDFEFCSGKERWLRRALYGWQKYKGDEHKSGWTEKLIRGYMEKYFKSSYEVRKCGAHWEHTDSKIKHLWVRAWKK